MKKLILSLSIVFYACSLLNAQKTSKVLPDTSSGKLSFNFGKVCLESKNETLKKIFYVTDKNIYATLTKDPAKTGYVSPKIKPVIVKYDESFNEVKRVEVEPDKGNDIYAGVYCMKGTIFFLKASYERKEKQINVIAQKYTDDLEIDGSEKTLWSFNGDEYNDADMFVEFSPDSSKCLVVLIPDPDKSKNLELQAMVFDEKLSSVYKGKLAYDKVSDQVSILNTAINNNADVFILSKVYNNLKHKQETSDDLPDYECTLKRLNSKGVSDLKFSNGSDFVHSYRLKIDSKGDLQFVVTLRNKEKSGVTAIKYFRYNAATGEQMEQTEFAVDKELAYMVHSLTLTNVEMTQLYKPEKSGLFREYLINILESPDGATYLTLEHDFYKSDNTGNEYVPVLPGDARYLKRKKMPIGVYAVQGTTTKTNGILVFKIAQSEVKWHNFIPKVQFYNQFDGYLFHIPVFHGNTLCIIYNDEKENEKYDFGKSKWPPKTFNKTKDANLMMVEFDEGGNMTRTKLASTLKLKTNIVTELSFQSGTDRITLCGLTMNAMGGDKKLSFGEARFK